MFFAAFLLFVLIVFFPFLDAVAYLAPNRVGQLVGLFDTDTFIFSHSCASKGLQAVIFLEGVVVEDLILTTLALVVVPPLLHGSLRGEVAF